MQNSPEMTDTALGMVSDMASDMELGTGWDTVSGTASGTASGTVLGTLLGKGSDTGFVSFRHNHKGCPDHSLREFESWKKDEF